MLLRRRASPEGLPEAAALDATIRRVVREELRAMLGRLADDEPRDYSSRRGRGPAGYAHRDWQAIAKAIGTRRGRWWVVSRAALEAYEASRQGATATPPLTPPANDAAAPAWSPRAALEAAGLRRQQT